MTPPMSHLCHAQCHDLLAMLDATEADRRPGGPAHYPEGKALRLTGHRPEVHPYDTFATWHPSRAEAEVYAAANLAHHGHTGWIADLPTGGAVYVTDLRAALEAAGSPLADPALPDDWTPQ